MWKDQSTYWICLQQDSWMCGGHKYMWICCCWGAASADTALQLCWNYQNKVYTRPAPPCLWLQSCIWVIQMPSSQIVSPKKRAVFFSLFETSFPSATSTRYSAANCNAVTLKSFFLSPGLDPCRKIQQTIIQIPRAVLRPIPNPSLNFFTFCRFYGLPWTLNTHSLIDSSRSPLNTNQSSSIPFNSRF
jgi:hypothetical protein